MDYDESGKQLRVTTLYSMEGRFENATEILNFNAFQDLLDFAKHAKKVTVQFTFGGSVLLTLATNKHGPRSRSVSLVQRPGSLATHAQFRRDLFSHSGQLQL